MQKVFYKEQLREYSEYLNAEMIDYLERGLTEAFEGFDDFDLMALPWYDDDDGAETETARVVIYIDREDLFFICGDERAYDRCVGLLPQEKSNERALYLFLVALLAQDARRLEQYETAITDAEDAALRNSRQDYLDSILEFRRELLWLRRYYEELNTITDHLTANDNGLFSKEGVRNFAIVRNRAAHFSGSVMSLRDYVTQMREACQSQIDIEQNKLMRLFTVVTAIFLPLTLIAGWYGMNFKYMPELSWRFGYPGVMLVCAAISVGLIVWFRRKKWF